MAVPDATGDLRTLAEAVIDKRHDSIAHLRSAGQTAMANNASPYDWWDATRLTESLAHGMSEEEAAFVAAASPQAILALLDALRDAVTIMHSARKSTWSEHDAALRAFDQKHAQALAALGGGTFMEWLDDRVQANPDARQAAADEAAALAEGGADAES